jgi:hypothetical protein
VQMRHDERCDHQERPDGDRHRFPATDSHDRHLTFAAAPQDYVPHVP